MCQSASVSTNCSLVIILSLFFILLSSFLPLPVTLLHRQALSDFCSDPNAFVLNSTNFNTGTSSGTRRTRPCARATLSGREMHCTPPPPTVLMSAELNIMTAKCSHFFFLLCTYLLCTGVLLAIQMCWIIT